jgi:arginine-tRNA-protein transferase
VPGETAALTYRAGARLEDEAFDQMLQRGWRRHGPLFFRPACPACRKCRSLRVVVDEFRPTRSQRRCLRRNEDIRLEVARPALTPAHLDLFDRYHADMHTRRGWPHRETTAHDYAASFLAGQFSFAYEFRYWDDETLVGVGLVDMTSHSGSSAYFYHDPSWRSQGPGVFSMLKELQVARQRGLRYHYLGYWIAECPSMAYKCHYSPHEILTHYVDDGQQPEWVRAER